MVQKLTKIYMKVNRQADINIGVAKNVSFSRRTLLHGVRSGQEYRKHWKVQYYRRINSTKSPASGARNVSKPKLVSQGGEL
jgi:hypothetical protein